MHGRNQKQEYHIALTQAVCADILEESLGKYLGWSVYRHS